MLYKNIVNEKSLSQKQIFIIGYKKYTNSSKVVQYDTNICSLGQFQNKNHEIWYIITW